MQMNKMIHGPGRILRTLCFAILSFIFLGAFFAAPLQAGSPVIEVEELYDIALDSTVETTISLQNPSGMAGFQLKLSYNPEVAVATGVSSSDSLPGSDPIVNLNNAERGTIEIAWMDLNSVHDNLDLFQVTFEVRGEGTTELKLESVELVDMEGSMPSQVIHGALSTVPDDSPEPKPEPEPQPDPEPDPQPDPEPDPEPEPRDLEIKTSRNLPNGNMDKSYSYTLSASGGSEPYTWEIKSGQLPSGLELDEDSGKISGTPEESGRYDLTVLVRDDEDETREKDLQLWISDGQDPESQPAEMDLSRYTPTGAVTFKSLTVAQGSMEVKLSPGSLPHTMVVDRNTGEINLDVEVYSSGDKILVNNTPAANNGEHYVTLQNGINNINLQIVSGDNISRQYVLTIFRIP